MAGPKNFNMDLQKRATAYTFCENKSMFRSSNGSTNIGFSGELYNIFDHKYYLSFHGGVAIGPGYNYKNAQNKNTDIRLSMCQGVRFGRPFPINESSCISIGTTVKANEEVGFQNNETSSTFCDYSKLDFGIGVEGRYSYTLSDSRNNKHTVYVDCEAGSVLSIKGSDNFEVCHNGLEENLRLGYAYRKRGSGSKPAVKVEVYAKEQQYFGEHSQYSETGVRVCFGLQDTEHVHVKTTAIYKPKNNNTGGIENTGCSNLSGNQINTGGITYEIGLKKNIEIEDGIYTAILEDGTKIIYKEQDPNKKAKIYKHNNGTIMFENISDATVIDNKNKPDTYGFMDCDNMNIDTSDENHKNDPDIIGIISTKRKSLQEMNIIIKKDEEDNIKKIGTNKEGTSYGPDPDVPYFQDSLPLTDEDDTNNIIVVPKVKN